MTDRERLFNMLEQAPGASKQRNSLDEIVDHLIANGVTIPVRCKDCKWYKIAPYDNVPFCSHESGYCGEHMGGLFYCACGERKDND